MNFAIFKKGKPIYWIIGGVVVFGLFYLAFNKGGSSSGGGITSVNTGPSDAAVAASTQLALAQTQANAGVAVATLQYNGTIAQTQAAADVAKYTAALDAQTSAATLDTQKAIAAINAEYSLDTARVAAESNLAQWNINANVLTTQMTTQAQMFSDQLRASTTQAIIAQTPNIMLQDRDNILALAAAANSGVSLTYNDRGAVPFTLGGK